MNIHPLFVHFAIGLLVVYSVLEVSAYMWPALRRQSWLFPMKAFLLFVGVLAAFAALFSGGVAEELLGEGDSRARIIELHDPFAKATTILYLILAAAYLVRIFDVKRWGDRIVGTNSFLNSISNFKKRFWYFVLDTWLLPALALFALIGMTVTGALGAAIVYGPDADPFVSFIYHLFWAQ